MRSVVFSIFVLILLTNCSNKKQVALPPAPASVDAVIKTINGKKFSTSDLALVSNLVSDKNDPYQWFDDIKDTTPFFKNYREKRMKTFIHFVNDSIAEITDDAGTNSGAWKVDDQPRSDETAGIFARIAVIKNGDSTLPGQTSPSKITFTYKVLGIDDKQIFVETPNMFNMRKVAALMKTE